MIFMLEGRHLSNLVFHHFLEGVDGRRLDRRDLGREPLVVGPCVEPVTREAPSNELDHEAVPAGAVPNVVGWSNESRKYEAGRYRRDRAGSYADLLMRDSEDAANTGTNWAFS